MTLRAIVFDHDGTLVDSEPMYARAWAKVLKGYGVPLYNFESYLSLIGRSASDAAELLIDEYDLKATAEQLLADRKQVVERMRIEDGVPLVTGVSNLIDWAVKQNLRLGISSGSNRDEVEASLHGHGLTMFEAISTRSDVIKNKPAPDVYLRTLEQLEVKPSEAIAIEDSSTGIQSAKSAGLLTLAIQHSYTPLERLRESDVVFRNFSDILKYLTKYLV